MTRSLSSLWPCVLFSLSLHAGTVEFAQWVPRKFISQELRKSQLSFERSESSFVLPAGDLKPVLKDLRFKVIGQIRDFNVASGVLSLDADGALEVSIGGIFVDQLITRDFGGNVIQVRVQATCSAASLRVPSLSLLSHFSFTNNNDFLPVLSDLDLALPAESWELSAPHCVGIGGIGEQIESTIKEALLHPASLTGLIRDRVAPFLNDWIRSEWPKASSSEGEWSDLAIASADSNGFLLKGNLSIDLADDVILQEIPPALKGETPKFFLSQEGFRVLMQDRAATLLPKFYDLRENASFRKLLGSRLMQFFAWPDLQRFSASTPFVLKNDPSSYVLSLKEDKSQWNATVSGKGSLITLMSGAPIDYLFYQLKVSVPMKMELVNGALRFSTAKADTSLQWNFGPLYQLLYRPDKRIPVNVLTGALATLVSQKSETIELPGFTIGDRTYKLNNLRTEDQLITMDWL
ncbi:MAG: hypothetical protein ACJ76H_08260 [Bacteriovoracaceae bacterium]